MKRDSKNASRANSDKEKKKKYFRLSNRVNYVKLQSNFTNSNFFECEFISQLFLHIKLNTTTVFIEPRATPRALQ